MDKIKRAYKSVYNFIKRIVDWALDTFFPNPKPALEGEPYCTTKGMWKKVLFYTVMIVAGIAGYFVLRFLLMNVFHFDTITFDLERGDTYSKFFQSGVYNMTAIEWVVFIITTISIAVTPIIRYLPFGSNYIATVYFVSVGYNTAFAYWGIFQKDIRIAFLVFIISLSLCAIPYILFKYKRIKLPKHFSDVVYVCYWVLVMGGTIFGFLSFIPGIGAIAEFFYELYKLPGAGEFLLVARIIIYFFFIFLCLERLLDFINKKAPKKNEWIVSFHLMYTVTIMINWCITYVLLNANDIMSGFFLNELFD